MLRVMLRPPERRLAVLLLLCALLAACASPTPQPTEARTPLRRLATVPVSPTPDAAARTALPTATPTLFLTRTPTPTVYIGTFMGAP
jgi:ABC-type uncharacterized transport system auxiliary subunit